MDTQDITSSSQPPSPSSSPQPLNAAAFLLLPSSLHHRSIAPCEHRRAWKRRRLKPFIFRISRSDIEGWGNVVDDGVVDDGGEDYVVCTLIFHRRKSWDFTYGSSSSPRKRNSPGNEDPGNKRGGIKRNRTGHLLTITSSERNRGSSPANQESEEVYVDITGDGDGDGGDGKKPEPILEGENPKKNDLFCFCDSKNAIRYWSISPFTCNRMSKQGGSAQVRFQPITGHLLAAVSDKVVSIFDVENDRQTHCFQGHSSVVNYLCWDHNGDLLASVSEDNIKVWSLASGECIYELNSSGNQFHSCVAESCREGKYSASSENQETAVDEKMDTTWEEVIKQCIKMLKIGLKLTRCVPRGSNYALYNGREKVATENGLNVGDSVAGYDNTSRHGTFKMLLYFHKMEPLVMKNDDACGEAELPSFLLFEKDRMVSGDVNSVVGHLVFSAYHQRNIQTQGGMLVS